MYSYQPLGPNPKPEVQAQTNSPVEKDGALAAASGSQRFLYFLRQYLAQRPYFLDAVSCQELFPSEGGFLGRVTSLPKFFRAIG